MKLVLIGRTSKQHKRMPQKVFITNTEAKMAFKTWFACILLEVLPEFLVDLYIGTRRRGAEGKCPTQRIMYCPYTIKIPLHKSYTGVEEQVQQTRQLPNQ